MTGAEQSLIERLADARSNKVIFVSHCMLDENVRYVGGAFHSGAAPETTRLIACGAGICQMSCPEFHAWGGVRKPRMLRAYSLRDTRLYRYRRPLFRLFTWYTRLRYRQLARHVVREIDRNLINERAVAACCVAGEGLFIAAVRMRLRRRGIDVPMIEYDLIAEMRGVHQRLDLNTRAAGKPASGQ